MRIIHTSDWHIGKVLNEFSMLEDQDYVLNRLVDFMTQQGAELLLVAGDLYDRSIPPTGAVELLDRLFYRLTVEANIPVIAVSGNHDSPQRLAFASRMAQQSGLYLEGLYCKDIRRITLQDTYGPIHFYCMPYLEPALVRADFPGEAIRSFDDAFRVVLEHNLPRIDPAARNILITHGFFSCARDPSSMERCDSELNIGGSDLIDAACLDLFDYVALGHLHRAQTAGRDHIRYSGSPLAYSISEAGANKSVTTVDLREKGVLSVKKLDLHPLHAMRVVRGSFDVLTAGADDAGDQNDYIFAELTDDSLIPNAMERLRNIYPNILGMRLLGRDPELAAPASAAAIVQGKTPEDLFTAFYQAMKNEEITAPRRQLVTELLERVEGGNNDEAH